ncbi:sensor histidine kinase [Streptomyces sp. KMM 9044]|uniref:sensor histidine kinase n=1 Tax=Streptomyces sp. KMM 9044 TaxID=2744474 RepID=UPI002151C12D|nr:histidine kinase [Streptomyces sp. KMM 9044]WAX81949.1 histidine kinase [Streptomyces sp. KMM 9044]
MWSRRQIVAEVVLALVVALSAALGARGDGALWMAVVAVAAAVMSLLRRVFPASVLVFTGAVTGLLSGFWVLLTVTGWSAGPRVAAPRRALASFAASYVLYAGLSVQQEMSALSVSALSALHVLHVLLFATLAFLATAVVPGLAGRYRTQRRTLLHALHEHNAQLLREREMIASHARLRERQRIAQDMHDSLGHQLALIAVHTGALEVDRDLTSRQHEAVGVLREAARAAMHELREAVGILRDGTQAQEREDDAEPAARGVAGIDGLVEASRGAGAAVELRRTGEARPLAPAADHAAYRIVQEALTNALKHAPGTSIVVELRYEPDSLVAEVANGPVPATAGGERIVVSGGQGLTGLEERARLVGGMVHAGPAADGGFRVAGVLPYGSRRPHAPDGGPGRAGSGWAATTFVDAENDFRGQSDGALSGDGGAVIDWSGPPDRQKELDIAMGSRKKGLVIGCGSALLVAVALGALAVVGIRELMEESGRAMIEPSVYHSVRVGDAESAVRGELPDGESFLTEGLDGGGPAKPKGAACLVLLSTEMPDGLDEELVFRFCFRDGELVQKRSYMVKT